MDSTGVRRCPPWSWPTQAAGALALLLQAIEAPCVSDEVAGTRQQGSSFGPKHETRTGSDRHGTDQPGELPLRAPAPRAGQAPQLSRWQGLEARCDGGQGHRR